MLLSYPNHKDGFVTENKTYKTEIDHDQEGTFMKKTWRTICAVLCSLTLLGAGTAVPASAATVNDVISAAYAVGIPSQYIQEGIAMYGGGNYTSEQCDQAIASIYSYQGRVDDLLYDYFGVEKPSSGGGNSATTPSGSNNGSGSNPAPVVTDAPQNNNESTVTTVKPFVDMTMQEKIDYVNQMPAEERSNYLSNLTPEERNSFIKQLPLNDKADVLNEFLGVGDSLGLHFTVDEMTNDTVVVSARDKNGKLIDVSAMGVTVEETGKSYTLPITIAALLAGGGVSGIAALVFFAGRKKQNEDVE